MSSNGYNFTERYDQDDKDKISALLVGRTVTKVDDSTLRLDGGTTLHLEGNDRACNAGCYDLIELNDCPINMITAVEFEDNPGGDGPHDPDEGYYRIFVLAHDERIKLADFEGTDGNGYYGTGYWIGVNPATVPA